MPDGDYSQAFWVACVPDLGMNFMTPGNPSTTANSEDTSLVLPVAEYNKRQEEGAGQDYTKFVKPTNTVEKERLEKAIEMNPTEPTLYYNVGVMNMDQKKTDEAIQYFKKAIELNPNYGDAYNNIGAAIIEKAAPIIDEMNKSLSDFNKYDKLQQRQFEIYRESVPYYEKAFELNKSSINVVQTLMGLYENLGMDDKLGAIKAVYEELKGE